MRRLILLLLVLLAPTGWADPSPQLPCVPPEFPNLSFSKDGSRVLLYGGSRREYFVWDLRKLELVANQKLDYEILGAQLSPDGKLLALGERPRRLVVLDLASKQRIFLHQGPSLPKGQDTGGYGVSWSPKGDMLVAWGIGFMREAGEPKCYLFSWPDQKLLRTFPGERQATSCGWTDKGALSVRAGGLRVYEPGTGKLLETIEEAKLDSEKLTHTLLRLGQIDRYYDDETSRAVFPGTTLTFAQAGPRAQAQGTTFHRGREQAPLGKVDWSDGCCLSPDKRNLAVLVKGGILLLDVEGTLSANKLVLTR